MVRPMDRRLISRPMDNEKLPFRVLHVVRSLEIGGLERLVCDLVSESRNCQSAVVCLTQIGTLGESLNSRGFPVTEIGFENRKCRTIRALCGQIKAFRPNIVHCHNMLAHFYGSICARLCGISTVVFSKHGTYFPASSMTDRLNLRLLRYSQTVAVSEQIEKLCAAKIRNPRYPILYIPNGLSAAPFKSLPGKQEARLRLGWAEQSFIAGVVARLSPGKGHFVLLEAFKEFGRQAPDTELAIIGDGEEFSRLQQAIVESGLEKRIHLLGARNDVPNLLAALDVFTLPSFDEGIPMTILEAMAARLPVVATDVGGIPQVVVDGETGLLIPPNSPKDLADALFAIYSEPERSRQMGMAGRKRFEEQFDSSKMVQNYEKLYSELLRSRNDSNRVRR